jgi:Rab GDP dissociation inhibitor
MNYKMIIDIYVMCLSSDHCVCPSKKYVAIISTSIETDNPEKEIAIALRLIGPVEEKFVHISSRFEPLEDGTKDKCFISKSYDESSHFESTAADVHSLYTRIAGKPMDLTPPTPRPEEENIDDGTN